MPNSPSSQIDIRPDDLSLIVRITAALEVLFTPFRFQSGGAHALAGVLERRRRYHDGGGIEFTVGGETSDRQRGFQGLRRLQSLGLVQLHKTGVHRTGVSLPRLDAALSVTPNIRLAACWPILELLATVDQDETVLRNGQDFLLEHDVLGLPRDTTDGGPSSKFEADAWPLVALDLAKSISDASGVIGWKITAAGREALAASPPDPYDLSDLYCPKQAEIYNSLVLQGLRDRENWEHSRATELAIPLSSGTWGTPAQLAEWGAETRRRRAERAAKEGDADA